MRFVILSFLAIQFATCENMATATKSCEATNNLKATKNSGNVHTEPNYQYRVLDSKPQSLYVQIPNVNPNGRWVSRSCFNVGTSLPNIHTPTQSKIQNSNTVNTKAPKQMILALSWHNGFCETHRGKSECKRSLFGNKEYGFVLHGLWPQPKNLAYCEVDKKIVGMDKNKQWSKMPNIGLDADTRKILANIMPATQSSLQNHEWYKHGTCSAMNSSGYFTKASNLTNEFNNSKLAKYINANIGNSIAIGEVKNLANSSFGAGSGEKIDMVCNNGLLVEMRLSLGVGQDLKSAINNGQNISSSCKNAMINKAGW